MAGLEVVRTLNDLGYETEAPIEIVAWTNEEGARFSPAMVGSGAFTGVFELESALATRDNNAPTSPRRRTRTHRLCRRGAGRRASGRRLFRGAYRAGADPRSRRAADRHRHRRAGPALVRDHRHRPGGACRADPDAAAARCAGRRGADDRRGQPHRPRARALCLRDGRLCPGQPQFAQHDPRPGVLHGRFPPSRQRGADRDGPRAARRLRRGRRVAKLEAEVKEFWYFPPTPFDKRMVGAVREAAAAQNLPHQDIVSGAGHDAVYMARVAPTAMIFVPCVGGISHNEIEGRQARRDLTRPAARWPARTNQTDNAGSEHVSNRNHGSLGPWPAKACSDS
jgi:N-carbamoyl-L-amino-acid hydrolase